MCIPVESQFGGIGASRAISIIAVVFDEHGRAGFEYDLSNNSFVVWRDQRYTEWVGGKSIALGAGFGSTESNGPEHGLNPLVERKTRRDENAAAPVKGTLYQHDSM